MSPINSDGSNGFRLARTAPALAEGVTCEADPECMSGACTNGRCGPAGYRYVPGGAFTMGSPTDEPGRTTSENQVPRMVSPFYLKTTEVTRAEFVAGGFNDPSLYPDCGSTCPVQWVNWWEALHYANQRSEAESRPACYTMTGCNANAVGADRECSGVTLEGGAALPVSCVGYRLPTEAEWEYAYRAGTTTAFHNGGISTTGYTPLDTNLAAIAWYGGNSRVTYADPFNCTSWGVSGQTTCGPQPVGGKLANAWGLRDMAGNVAEWTWDRSAVSNAAGVSANWAGPASGTNRVYRGGSWYGASELARGAERTGKNEPGWRGRFVGLRLARTAPNAPDGAVCAEDWQCASGFCGTTSQCMPTGTTVPSGYRYIPGGQFTIGSPTDEAGRANNENQVPRAVSSFFLKTTEVTQGEWTSAGYTNPSGHPSCGSTCPVELVNWWEALHFANHQSTAAGLSSCYTMTGCNANAVGADRECTGVTLQGGSLPSFCSGYRLPTEAEWEYAYRAGTTTAFYNAGILAPYGTDGNLPSSAVTI